MSISSSAPFSPNPPLHKKVPPWPPNLKVGVALREHLFLTSVRALHQLWGGGAGVYFFMQRVVRMFAYTFKHTYVYTFTYTHICKRLNPNAPVHRPVRQPETSAKPPTKYDNAER